MGTLIFIAYDHGDRGSGGLSFKHSGEDFYFVTFITGSSIAALSGFSPVKISLYICFCKEKTCGNTIHYSSKRFSMGFSPGSNREFFSKC
jgi:hypothetical protein